MNIKEIVLKAGHSTVPAYWLSDEKPIACSTSNFEKLVSFATALIAEVAKQNEPVCEWVKAGNGNYLVQKWAKGYVAMQGYKLYTIPPTAEQIANETAEAIAKMLDDAEVEETHYCMNTYEEGKKFQFDMVETIRSGAWKDFKK